MQLRIHWLLAALIAAAILAVAHAYATEYHLYYAYRWLDTPMHLLGGFAIGLFAIGLLHARRALAYASVILAVAIGWEVFEYIFGISTGQPGYWFDTIHDIVNDLIGGTAAYALARYTLWR